MPIAQTFDSGAGTGTITFDQPLDQAVVLDPADWSRGINQFAHRDVVTLEYGAADRIDITSMSGSQSGGFPVGWRYVVGAAQIRGTNGIPVAAFSGFTG